MEHWTMKQMEDADNLSFVIYVLSQKANKFCPTNPFHKKLKAAIKELEEIKGQRTVEETDVYDTLYELVMAKYVRMKILHDHLWNAPFVRAVDIDELDMRVAFTELIKFKGEVYCAVYFKGATKPSCYLKGETTDDYIFAIYEDIGNGVYGVVGQYENVVFATDTEAYKKLDVINIEKGIVNRKSTSKYLYETLCNLIIHEGVEIPSFVSIPFEDYCLPPRIETLFLDDLYLVADYDDVISANDGDYYAIRKYGTVDIIGYLNEDAIEDEVYIIYEELERGRFGVPKDKFLNQAVFMTYHEANDVLQEMLKD